MAFSWRTRSFRFWLTAGLLLAILPMAASAILGHVLLNRGVIGSFADVAARQRTQLLPTHRLRALILDAAIPVDEFVDDGDPVQPPAYHALRERVEAAFDELHRNLAAEADPRALIERAREDWAAGDKVATEILSVRRPGGDPHDAELLQRFDGLLEAATDKLTAVSTDIERDVTADHDEALRFYERSEWIMSIAFGVSLITIIVAVIIISRIMSSSVDRLVTGAERFASGDREHRIDVAVPPELHSVAEEFNRMIERIHESEAALADLARRDGLTKLLNRRAFDDALAEMAARLDRVGGRMALLMIDIDHFKKINDTYGHGVGDDVLKAVARTLTADVRLVDAVFRLGGEEFGVLLYGAEAESATATAERLRRSVEEAPVLTPKGRIAVTISVGSAAHSAGEDLSTFVAAAHAALYRAKQAGRNRVIS
jgi:diguanylate cyclase (GGDEF)-like protein